MSESVNLWSIEVLTHLKNYEQDLVFSVKLKFKQNLCAWQLRNPSNQKLCFIPAKKNFIGLYFWSEKIYPLAIIDEKILASFQSKQQTSPPQIGVKFKETPPPTKKNWLSFIYTPPKVGEYGLPPSP